MTSHSHGMLGWGSKLDLLGTIQRDKMRKLKSINVARPLTDRGDSAPCVSFKYMLKLN